jgi:hypothetical protein
MISKKLKTEEMYELVIKRKKKSFTIPGKSNGTLLTFLLIMLFTKLLRKVVRTMLIMKTLESFLATLTKNVVYLLCSSKLAPLRITIPKHVFERATKVEPTNDNIN